MREAWRKLMCNNWFRWLVILPVAAFVSALVFAFLTRCEIFGVVVDKTEISLHDATLGRTLFPLLAGMVPLDYAVPMLTGLFVWEFGCFWNLLSVSRIWALVCWWIGLGITIVIGIGISLKLALFGGYSDKLAILLLPAGSVMSYVLYTWLLSHPAFAYTVPLLGRVSRWFVIGRSS